MGALIELSEKELGDIFGPKVEACGAAKTIVAEFANSGAAASEVDWRQIHPTDFQKARQRLSDAVIAVRHNPSRYGVMTREEFNRRLKAAETGDRSYNPLYDVGTKSLPKDKRVFLFHKKAEEITSLKKAK